MFILEQVVQPSGARSVEGEGYISPVAVRKTQTPPAIPDRVKLNDKEATVFIQDIYEGEGLRGIPRGYG